MKKFLTLFAFVMFASASVFALDLGSSLKSAAKDQAKASATGEVLTQINTQLNGVQSDKGLIVFKTGTAVLDVDKCKNTLDALSVIINGTKGFKVEVNGHTDNVGNAAANKTLSQKRAQSVVDWLVENGAVDKARLSAKGYGSTKPVADNKTEAGRAQNRRVDFTVIK